ncbi:MAG TPA: VOC family protein [Candidatus Saccharimonadales bacterium]|jgi:predicted enzyme related to lactoylglutathione lyase|nr:VOC family protein [Candidatus Saccharimonadales bacterium]
MDRVVHFEITADDPQRAAEFYRKAFGWTFQAMPGRFTYLLATTGKDKAGIDGAIMGRTEMKQSVINTIAVDDFEASVKAVIAAGGQMVQEKHAIPGVGWSAYAKDTEGNVFGIYKDDPQAK